VLQKIALFDVWREMQMLLKSHSVMILLEFSECL
jgi:hypothetical protein